MKRKLGYKSGLTLLEVLISLVIFMIILVPVISMIISSVNANIDSEDKLRAAAIAQEYMESIKASDVVEAGTKPPETKDGYTILQTITPDSDYNFETQQSGRSSEDIKFDMKIVIDEDNNLKVYGNDNIIYFQQNNLTGQQAINIKNDKSSMNNNESSIYFELEKHSGHVEVPKINSKDWTGNIKFELIGRQEEQDNQNDGIENCTVNLKINVSNLSVDKYCNLYFVKPQNTKSINKYYEFPKYSVVNKEGMVKSYSNIIVNKQDYKNTSRLYKVDIKVEKKGKLLQQITAYKTFYE